MPDKTERPSPRRLRQARAKGDIPVSLALTQSGALIAAVAVLPTVVSWTAHQSTLLVQSAIRGELEDPRHVLEPILMLGLPVLAAAATGALAFGFAQTGGAFNPSKLTPNLRNLDLGEGFQRLFRRGRVYPAIRALLAAGLVAWLTTCVVLDESRSIANTAGRPELAAALAGTLASQVLWWGVAVSSILAVIDVWVTRQAWLQRNRMTKDEVKREHKESEGDPRFKHERKRAHQEMLTHATVLSVRDANVVIVNPVQLATALRYESGRDDTPIVVAQGHGDLARRIADAARGYGIPVVLDAAVARALSDLEVGDEIPESLYEAVAEILRGL